MDSQVLIGFLLSFLPISELSGGLPVIVEYCLSKGISVWPYFLIVLLINISAIIFVFFFFDFLHEHFMKIGIYRKFIGKVLSRIQKKVDKTKEGLDSLGFIALTLFVSIPLPGSGAWTGTLIAWVLGADRIKSFIAIALGIIINGFLVLFASLGFFWLY